MTVMKQQLKRWLGYEEDGRSIRADIRTGQAGWPIRLGLSLAAAAVLVAPLMFIFGLLEASGIWVREEHFAIGLAIAGAVWCGVLVWLWSSFRRWRRVIRTTLSIIIIWTTTVVIAAVLDMVIRDAMFLVTGVIFLAIAITIGLIATVTYQSLGGKPLMQEAETIRVFCPHCKYSLVGLQSCTCPECGASFTIDEIIRAQDYAAIRRESMESESSNADQPPATATGPTPLQLKHDQR